MRDGAVKENPATPPEAAPQARRPLGSVVCACVVTAVRLGAAGGSGTTPPGMRSARPTQTSQLCGSRCSEFPGPASCRAELGRCPRGSRGSRCSLQPEPHRKLGGPGSREAEFHHGAPGKTSRCGPTNAAVGLLGAAQSPGQQAREDPSPPTLSSSEPIKVGQCPEFPNQKSKALPFSQDTRTWSFFSTWGTHSFGFSLQDRERVCTTEASAGLGGITKSDIYFC